MEKLTKSVKTKLVNALRSGQFKQGKDYLYDSKTNTYSALGVLAAIMGGVPDRKYFLTYENAGKLPKKLIANTELQDKLAAANKNNSFNWIASYVERYL